jgi:hypothetical protein
VNDFFILSGAVLVGVFATLVSTVQHLVKQLEALRAANEYLSKRLAGEIREGQRRFSPPEESDKVCRQVRAEVDRELQEFLDIAPDQDPMAWEMRGNPRSYR